MKLLEEKITTFDNDNVWNEPAGDNQKDRKPEKKEDLENLDRIVYSFIEGKISFEEANKAMEDLYIEFISEAKKILKEKGGSRLDSY